MLGAWVALVQQKHNRTKTRGPNVVYQAIIHYPENKVNRLEQWSGITKEMLETGVELRKVQADLVFFLENYKIIGVDIKQDLLSLGLESYVSKCIDIQTSDSFYRGRNNIRLSLKDLAYKLTGKEIQKKNGCAHSPVIDARLTIKLYYLRVEGYAESESDSDGDHNFEFCRHSSKK